MKKAGLIMATISTLTSFAMLDMQDDPELEHECTSWMVFNDLTKNNTNILHKNRDSKVIDVAVLLSPANSKRKWIALGSGKCNMAINASGLAGVMNSGEICSTPTVDETKKRTPAMMQVIIDSCDTAAQAVKKLKQLVDEGDYYHSNRGSIFFLMDTKEGYICEFTTDKFTVQPYNSGYAVRANIWQNPGMQFYSRNTIKRHLDSSARAHVAFDGLNQMLDKEGKITLSGIFELSRHYDMPESSNEKRSVCYKNTCSTSSLEIDLQYPDVLSTGYFSIGHPRNTIYIPVPVCAEKILPSMGDYSWSKAACKRFAELGFGAPIPETWAAFESNAMAEYAKAKEDARKLLDAGKRDDAVKLLNETAYKIWCGAEKLLNI